MSHVLIVEDEAHLAKGLQFNLEAEGHSVAVVGDGERALDMLLGKSGDPTQLRRRRARRHASRQGRFHRGRGTRAAKQYVPVLMLTARGTAGRRVKGFASGADDYLPKPFELPILLARLQGLLRRREWMRQSPAAKISSALEYEEFSFHGRTIDFGKLELRVNGNTIQLTLMEAELLRHLIRNQGRIVSRKSILEEVWGLHEDTDTRAIDNFMVRLRRYIEDNPAEPRHLLTVRGVGYRFVPEPDEE